MKTVQFTKAHAPYQAGEIASLPDAMADALVTDGTATDLAKPETQAVKFVAEYPPYVPGDVVDLDAKLAAHVIDEGVAKSYQPTSVMPLAANVTIEATQPQAADEEDAMNE